MEFPIEIWDLPSRHGAWTAEGQAFGSEVATQGISVREMVRSRRSHGRMMGKNMGKNMGKS